MEFFLLIMYLFGFLYYVIGFVYLCEVRCSVILFSSIL